MNFIYPGLLLALLALIVPIIIHLFNFRKFEKVYFPDIRFLQEIKQQTNKSRNVKKWLLLLLRLLLFASLILAFVQPFLGAIIKNQRSATAIFIDNSNSMLAENGEQINLLQNAKNIAKKIINSCGSNDQFQILSNSGNAQELQMIDKENALAAVDQIVLCNEQKELAEIFQLQNTALNATGHPIKKAVVISDFQKNIYPFPTKLQSSTTYSFVPLTNASQQNLSIDSAWFDRPNLKINEKNTIYVQIQNRNQEQSSKTNISLSDNNQIKQVQEINLAAKEVKTVAFDYASSKAGWQDISLYIKDYPIQFDDTFYLSCNINADYNILIVNNGNNNPYLTNAFKVDPRFRTIAINSQMASQKALDPFSLIILDGISAADSALVNRLEKYIQNGGHVLLFPNLNTIQNNFNKDLGIRFGINLSALDTAKKQITFLNKEHPVIKNTFESIKENMELPTVTKQLKPIVSSFASEQKILGFSDGSSFLSSYKYGNGNFYLCTSPADGKSNSFCTSYLFLPILYNMSFASKSENYSNYIIGKNIKLLIDNYAQDAAEKNLFHVKGKGFDGIPEQKQIGSKIEINPTKILKTAGVFSIEKEIAMPGKNTLIGVNYNRNESDLSFYNAQNLTQQLGLENVKVLSEKEILSKFVNAKDETTWPIWKYLLIFALLCLLLEIILTRFLKNH